MISSGASVAGEHPAMRRAGRSRSSRRPTSPDRGPVVRRRARSGFSCAMPLARNAAITPSGRRPSRRREARITAVDDALRARGDHVQRPERTTQPYRRPPGTAAIRCASTQDASPISRASSPECGVSTRGAGATRRPEPQSAVDNGWQLRPASTRRTNASAPLRPVQAAQRACLRPAREPCPRRPVTVRRRPRKAAA